MSTLHDELVWHKTMKDGPSEMQQAIERGQMVLIMPVPMAKEEK